MINSAEFIVVFLSFLWGVSVWGALTSISPGRVRKIEEKNRALAEKIDRWLAKRDEYEIILRFIILFAAGVITVYCFIFYTSIFEKSSPYLIALLSSATTFLLLLVTEIITGILINLFDLNLLKISMPILIFFRRSFFLPIVLLILSIRNRIQKIQGIAESGRSKKTSAEDEILSLVEKGNNESALIEETEKQMIKGVFNLDDTYVREIMTPRVDVQGIPSNASLDEARKKIIESGHSRVPVYDDTIDNIKGILFAKDMLDEEKIRDKKLLEIARQPLFIPENKTVIQVLEEFKRKSNHFAVVIDEYGGTAGIVTFEDIIEQIVGEIGDEYDTHEDTLPDRTELPDGSIIFDGRALVSELASIFEGEIDDIDGIDTVGGYVSAKIGRIPETGEQFTLNNSIQVTILKADRRRIRKLKIGRKK